MLFLTLGCGGSGGGAGQGGDGLDFRRPGSFGPLVGEASSGTEFSAERRPIPFEPPCDVAYEVLVRVREPVTSCVGYDFRALYDRAVALAGARATVLRCPSGCTPLSSIVDQRWICVDGFAVVLLNMMLMCCSVNGPGLPPRVAPPPPGPILGDQPGSANPSDDEEWTFQPSPPQIPCPGSHMHVLDYHVSVPSCAGVTDYEPYVIQAREWAPFAELFLSCSSPCQKLTDWNVRNEWSCSGNVVHVRVFVRVNCVP